MGAQRVLNYRVFLHHSGIFPEHKEQLEERYKEYRILVKETSNHPTLRGAGMYFKARFKELIMCYGNYQRLWNQYFAIHND